MSSYDRRTKIGKVMFESVVHKAAEADDLVHKAYLSLHSFKFGMDEMEEIPPRRTEGSTSRREGTGRELSSHPPF